MATKIVCDRCGSENDVGKIRVDIGMSPPFEKILRPSLNHDFCLPCGALVIDHLRSACRLGQESIIDTEGKP